MKYSVSHALIIAKAMSIPDLYIRMIKIIELLQQIRCALKNHINLQNEIS